AVFGVARHGQKMRGVEPKRERGKGGNRERRPDQQRRTPRLRAARALLHETMAPFAGSCDCHGLLAPCPRRTLAVRACGPVNARRDKRAPYGAAARVSSALRLS